MVRISDPENYKFLRFEKSNNKGKMYNAILVNKSTNRERKVPFGDSNMENYRDKTGLNLYPNLIHGDKERRKSFRARHKENAKHKFSSAYFSYNYLW